MAATGAGLSVALLLSRGDHCWAMINFTYSPLLDPCTNRGAGAFCHTSSESVRSQRRCLSRKLASMSEDDSAIPTLGSRIEVSFGLSQRCQVPSACVFSCSASLKAQREH